MQKVFVLTGATAIGKSSVTENLFDVFPELLIISADSRQVYKELSIGTAKPSKQIIEKLKMSLVDHVSIHEEYNAGIYERQAINIIEKSENQSILLSGGTGLYIKAICEGLNNFPFVDSAIKDQLNLELENEGIEKLKHELNQKDPEYYMLIDNNNPHRILRALGVIRVSNKTFSSFQQVKNPQRNFEVHYINLVRPREELYNRINQRVMMMIEQGLVNEVKSLVKFSSLKALQTVGYTELFNHLDGQITLDEAIAQIQMHSRRYAKRQITWNKNQFTSDAFHPDQINEIADSIKSKLQNR